MIHTIISAIISFSSAPSAVSGLTATPFGRGSLRISWDSPDTSTNECSIDRYQVTYRLIRHIACGPEEGETARIELTVETRSVTINNLEDYAEYLITVTAEVDEESSLVLSNEETSVRGTTEEAGSQIPFISIFISLDILIYWIVLKSVRNVHQV